MKPKAAALKRSITFIKRVNEKKKEDTATPVSGMTGALPLTLQTLRGS